jgi:hypothetical protein
MPKGARGVGEMWQDIRDHRRTVSKRVEDGLKAVSGVVRPQGVDSL